MRYHTTPFIPSERFMQAKIVRRKLRSRRFIGSKSTKLRATLDDQPARLASSFLLLQASRALYISSGVATALIETRAQDLCVLSPLSPDSNRRASPEPRYSLCLRAVTIQKQMLFTPLFLLVSPIAVFAQTTSVDLARRPLYLSLVQLTSAINSLQNSHTHIYLPPPHSCPTLLLLLFTAFPFSPSSSRAPLRRPHPMDSSGPTS
jgi:hypothetical protein